MRPIGVGTGFEHPEMAAALEDRDFTVAPGGPVGGAKLLLECRQDVVVEATLHNQQGRQFDRLATLQDQLRVALFDIAERVEINMVAVRHLLPPLGHRIVVARQGVADRRACRHIRTVASRPAASANGSAL